MNWANVRTTIPERRYEGRLRVTTPKVLECLPQPTTRCLHSTTEVGCQVPLFFVWSWPVRSTFVCTRYAFWSEFSGVAFDSNSCFVGEAQIRRHSKVSRCITSIAWSNVNASTVSVVCSLLNAVAKNSSNSYRSYDRSFNITSTLVLAEMATMYMYNHALGLARVWGTLLQ